MPEQLVAERRTASTVWFKVEEMIWGRDLWVISGIEKRVETHKSWYKVSSQMDLATCKCLWMCRGVGSFGMLLGCGVVRNSRKRSVGIEMREIRI